MVWALPALGLNPAYQISQYPHTSWRADAGIAAVRRIKQTPDGYLWLATRGGLVRFDGVRFSTFKAGSEQELQSSTTQDLVIDPDGSMWIATLGGGIAHYQGGKFHSYTAKDGLPSDDVGSLYRDSNGTLWVGTRGQGIARMVHGRFEKVPLAIPPSPITAFLEGPDHSLWIASFGYGVFRLQNGMLASFSAQDGLPDNRVTGLYHDHSGRMWTAGWKGISFWNGARFIPDAAVNSLVSYAISCAEDRDGNLWIASSSGLFRARGAEVVRIDRRSGLSGDFTSDIFEDREGNLWAGTRGGLDRFRDGQTRIFSENEGLIPDPGPIVADDRGVWTASNRRIARLSGNKIGAWPAVLPAGSTSFTLLSKSHGAFFIGFDQGVMVWSGAPSSIPELQGLGVRSLFQARDGSIWIGTANRGLLRWNPSVGSRMLTETGVSEKFIATIAEDQTGAIWAGSNQGGGLYRVAGGKVEHFGSDQGMRSPNVYTLFVDKNGKLWIGSIGGLSWFQDGRIRSINSHQGLRTDQVFAILDDSYDRLWFTGYAGLEVIDKKSLVEWASGLRQKVSPILYRSADGFQVRSIENVFPNAVRTPDGHLWFSVEKGLAEVTPPAPAVTRAPQFPVLVEEVSVDGVSQSELRRIRMPPGARSIDIRYTALTLSNSEALRFRYRMEGINKEWVDADARRLAFYDNLKPGTYTFRVAASAGEEEWQESPPLLLEQLPFFYQTWWFTLIASATVLSLVFFVYRLRLRQAVDRVQAGFQQRIDERTRIARDLHDTLLQSFSGLMLRLQVVDELIPNGRAKEQLEIALRRGDMAMEEARSAVYELRSSALPTDDLAEAVTAVANEFASDDSPTFRLDVQGTTRVLHTIVRDEVYGIAREALRNAFTHAGARHIEAEITYTDRLLCVRIRDDGRGIPEAVLQEGRSGHYGLAGMRERSAEIQAQLTIWSEAGAGSEIELSIPGSIAYAATGRRLRPRLLSRKAGQKS